MKHKGFTLVEMIVVLAIVATVTWIALVRMQTFENRKAKEEVKELSRIVTQAKEKAILEKRGVEVIFDTNNNCVSLRYVEEQYPFLKKEFSNIEIYADTWENKTLLFTRHGAPDGGVSLRIRWPDKRLLLTIRPVTGKVTIYAEKN